MIRVTVSKDGEVVKRWDVDKDELIVGRGSEADVQLAAEAVSRRHARSAAQPEEQAGPADLSGGRDVEVRGGVRGHDICICTFFEIAGPGGKGCAGRGPKSRFRLPLGAADYPASGA